MAGGGKRARDEAAQAACARLSLARPMTRRWPCLLSVGEARALRWAAASRVAVLAVALVADAALEDYDSSARLAGSAPCLGGAQEGGAQPPSQRAPLLDALVDLVSWDVAHLLRVARCGYDTEQSRAFYPGVPLALRAAAAAAAGAEAASSHSPAHVHALLALAALALSVAGFVAAAVLLHRLTTMLWRNEKLADSAVALLCASPAAPFLSLGYTEAPFAAITLGAHVAMAEGRGGVAATLYALAAAMRSNGVLNAGHAWCAALLWLGAQQRRTVHALALAAAAALALSLPVLVVPALVELWAYRDLCVGAGADALREPRPWCARWPLTSAYGFIQHEYWGQGAFAFWRLEQLPNFATAAPALALAFWSAAWGLRQCAQAWAARGAEAMDGGGKRLHLLGLRLPLAAPCAAPFGALAHFVQLGAMATLCLTCMHVQTAGRFLCAQPALYWGAASVAMRGGWAAWAVWAYSLAFACVGTVAFVNGLPYV